MLKLSFYSRVTPYSNFFKFINLDLFYVAREKAFAYNVKRFKIRIKAMLLPNSVFKRSVS